MLDELDQLMQVVALVARDTCGQRTGKPGAEQLRSPPGDYSPNLPAFRWHLMLVFARSARVDSGQSALPRNA